MRYPVQNLGEASVRFDVSHNPTDYLDQTVDCLRQALSEAIWILNSNTIRIVISMLGFGGLLAGVTLEKGIKAVPFPR
jgi:hypothetical protein